MVGRDRERRRGGVGGAVGDGRVGSAVSIGDYAASGAALSGVFRTRDAILAALYGELVALMDKPARVRSLTARAHDTETDARISA